MGATTASVLVGVMHRNDELICPSHLAQLIEGDRAAWILTDLSGQPRAQVVWLPASPEQVLPALLALIAQCVTHDADDPQLRGRRVCLGDVPADLVDRFAEQTAQRRGVALSATVSAGSSLRPARLRELRHLDVELHTREWSRVWSVWSDGWSESDVRA